MDSLRLERSWKVTRPIATLLTLNTYCLHAHSKIPKDRYTNKRSELLKYK
jgi:hypothetical protein